MAFCMNCGAELLEGAAFCIKCGARVDEDFEQEQPGENSEEPIATEETAKAEKTANAEETGAAEEPANTEEPAKAEETAKVEAVVTIDQNYDKTELVESEQEPVLGFGLGQGQELGLGPELSRTLGQTHEPIRNEALKEQTQKPVKKKGRFLKVLILILVIAALGVSAVLFFKKTVAPPVKGGASFTLLDIRECVKVETEGNDGLGTLTLTVDTDEIYDILRGGGYDLSKSEAQAVAESVVVAPAKVDNLSNGEEVLLTATADTNIMSEHDIRFAQSTWGYTVSGLTPTIKIDPFEYVSVYFEGISPKVSVDYEAREVNSDIGTLSYEFDRRENLAKGDEITLKCTSDVSNYIEDGYSFSQTEKTYVVDDVIVYINLPEEINEEGLARMKKEAGDNIGAMLTEHELDESPVHNTGLKFEGVFILNKKQLDGGDDNVVYLLYSTNIYSDIMSNTTVYFPFRFDDVVEYVDGTVGFDDYYPDYGHDSGLFPHGTWLEDAFPGYSDTTIMFSKLVRSRTDEYNYELDESIAKMF